jgi:hypothetical protein
MAYDPSKGPPTWPSADTPTLDDFERNKQKFLDWNAAAGLVREVTPGTYTNAIPYAPGLPSPQKVRDFVVEARAAMPADVTWPPALLPAMYAAAGAGAPSLTVEAAAATEPGAQLQLQAGTPEGMLAELLERYRTPAIAAAVLLVLLFLFWRR